MELVVGFHAKEQMLNRGIPYGLMLDCFDNGYVKVVNNQYRYYHELITLVVDIYNGNELKLVTAFPSRKIQNKATAYNRTKRCGMTTAQRVMLERFLESYNKSYKEVI
jgi:hypothetical protein